MPSVERLARNQEWASLGNRFPAIEPAPSFAACSPLSRRRPRSALKAQVKGRPGDAKALKIGRASVYRVLEDG
jgi:hypothetical protein